MLNDVIQRILGNAGQDASFGTVSSGYGYNALIKGKRFWFWYVEDSDGNQEVFAFDRDEHGWCEDTWNAKLDSFDEWDTRMGAMAEIYALQ